MKNKKLTMAGVILGVMLIGATGVMAEGGKCGAGKCGNATDTKKIKIMDGNKTMDKKPAGKCGAGKCGDGK